MKMFDLIAEDKNSDDKKAEEDKALLSAFKKVAKLMGLKPDGLRALASRASLSSKEQDLLAKTYRDAGYY